MAAKIPYPCELTTERLMLRSPAAEDVPLMREAVIESLAELRPWMPWAANEPKVEDTQENNDAAIERFKAGSDFVFRIFLRETGQLLGSCGLHRMDWQVPRLEIGYWIRTAAVGQGFATEAIGELMRFVVQEFDARRVEIHIDAENVKSRRVAEKLGFELEGTLRNYERDSDGQLRDKQIYAVVR